jgi:hypothetical protein
MARSNYIYVVNALTPVAAFTVKHELLTWLGKQEGLDGLTVYRLTDGAKTHMQEYLSARGYLSIHGED